MITLIPKRRVRVPDPLAVFAALLLTLAAFSGTVNKPESNPQAKQDIEAVAPQAESATASTESPKRKLNISTLLFGNG